MRAVIAILLCMAPFAAAQAPGEVSSEDTGITFKSRVNLVPVPVVVRDSHGKVIGNLQKEDFRLFDNGKPQTIERFSVERADSRPAIPTPQTDSIPGEGTPASPIVPADHFVAYVFDDIHLSEGDLSFARDAARKFVAGSLLRTDRIAVYTTSGQTSLDFTDDREKLEATLVLLRARPVARTTTPECPDISHYMADLIVNKHDRSALAAATAEAMSCSSFPDSNVAQSFTEGVAARVLQTGEHETRVALISIENVVRRMTAMPGQRLIVLVSPGFLRPLDQFEKEAGIMERAIRGRVTINAMDARGLYVGGTDSSHRIVSPEISRIKDAYQREADFTQADVMEDLSAGTGGSFIRNTNDLAAGLKQLSTVPEVWYVLSFSPQNLKVDGAYHALKVVLRSGKNMNAKARRGYYAPRRLTSADEQSKEEISEALFSREELNEIPIVLHSQFFKSSDTAARLSVVARIDIKQLHFRKEEGRSGDEVMIVSGLFDRDGKFLQAVSKKLTMRLKDETLATRLGSGVSIRSDFNVTSGTYVIRLVVRDAEGEMMAARNSAVEIP